VREDQVIRAGVSDVGLLEPEEYASLTTAGLLLACKRSDVKIGDFERAYRDRLLATAENDTILLAGTVSLDVVGRFLPVLRTLVGDRVYDVRAAYMFCRSLGMHRLNEVTAWRSGGRLMNDVEAARACSEWMGKA
jgi:hypothetical protein